MVDWQQQTKRELFDHAKALDVDVSMSMTKKEIYQATLAHLRDELADTRPAEDFAERLRNHGIEATVVDTEPLDNVIAFTAEEDDDDVMFVGAYDDEEPAWKVKALPAAVPGPRDPVDVWHEEAALLPERPSTLPEVSRWEQMQAMAKVLCRSALMPAHIRNSRDPEADCMVILLTAHDLGLTTTLAIRKIAVIDGAPALAADLQRMLVLRDGHDLDILVPCPACDLDVSKPNPECGEHATAYPTEARVTVHRKEWAVDDWRGARYTLTDAQTANLCKIVDGRAVKKSRSGNALPWEASTEDMLVARASSRCIRRFAADCLGGISYTPEELGAIDADEAEPHEPSIPIVQPRMITDRERQVVIDAIDDLPDSQRAWLRAKWKESGLASVTTSDPLSEHWLGRVVAMLNEAAAQPVDAEIVADVPPCETDPAETAAPTPPETPETVTPNSGPVDVQKPPGPEPGPAGRASPAEDASVPSDRQVDGVPDRGGPPSQPGGPVPVADPARYARQLREQTADRLAAARAKFEAVCPDCGQPNLVANDKCQTHPF